ncbi:MAG: cell division protein FtsQ/DivIB [Parvibaculaceae bacterium]
MRILARLGGIAFLALTITYGLIEGEHLQTFDGQRYDPAGRIASYFGYAADDIRISGLKWQKPAAVLAAVGVRPHGALIGFDPSNAKRLLENLDWVESAQVQRLFPNQLEIHVVEREPFAVWQRDGAFYVIDSSGAALSSVSPAELADRIVVTGEGAQRKAAELVNHLEAHPALRSHLRAAARVGDRRWTLYLTGNVKVLLPETGIDEALTALEGLQTRTALLDKGVKSIDLRLEGSAVITPIDVPENKRDALVASRR